MPDRPIAETRHRFSFRLFGLMLGTFVAVFCCEAAIDIARSAAKANRPLAEIWPEIEGSWYSAVQAGACLARAGYSMLGMCVSVFVLSIPFSATFYTPKLVEVYCRDRVNRAAFALGVVCSAFAHFQTTIVWTELLP
ncbi:MAG TPA: hypothetical protein VHF22_08385, partial [Planctomycetota bacterium]|nr:hypothetical protein [Planctomycetota bacterium]